MRDPVDSSTRKSGLAPRAFLKQHETKEILSGGAQHIELIEIPE